MGELLTCTLTGRRGPTMIPEAGWMRNPEDRQAFVVDKADQGTVSLSVLDGGGPQSVDSLAVTAYRG